MRTAFIQQLVIEARRNSNIFLVVGDLGYSVIEPFAAEFPDRFLNAGVAEQNMAGIAAGLASEGHHVFTYSIGNFPTMRCAEQIRNDIAYHNLPVTVVAVGGGLAYGSLGYSHHAVQDIALMRSFPGLLLACPGDPEETIRCVQALILEGKPSYLRLGKAGEPKIHKKQITVRAGEFIKVKTTEGSKVAILTTGATLALVCQTVETASIACDVYSLPLWDYASARGSVKQIFEKYSTVTVVQDHLLAGGFSSFLAECLLAEPSLVSKIRSVYLDNAVCGQIGSQSALNSVGGVVDRAIIDSMV